MAKQNAGNAEIVSVDDIHDQRTAQRRTDFDAARKSMPRSEGNLRGGLAIDRAVK